MTQFRESNMTVIYSPYFISEDSGNRKRQFAYNSWDVKTIELNIVTLIMPLN